MRSASRASSRNWNATRTSSFSSMNAHSDWCGWRRGKYGCAKHHETSPGMWLHPVHRSHHPERISQEYRKGWRIGTQIPEDHRRTYYRRRDAGRFCITSRRQYEEHHNVSYTDEALKACVKLAERYMHDRLFPDKAIDVMDEAGAHIHINSATVLMNSIEAEKAQRNHRQTGCRGKPEFRDGCNIAETTRQSRNTTLR